MLEIALEIYILDTVFLKKDFNESKTLDLGGKARGRDLQASHLLPPGRQNCWVLSATCTAGAGEFRLAESPSDGRPDLTGRADCVTAGLPAWTLPGAGDLQVASEAQMIAHTWFSREPAP